MKRRLQKLDGFQSNFLNKNIHSSIFFHCLKDIADENMVTAQETKQFNICMKNTNKIKTRDKMASELLQSN